MMAGITKGPDSTVDKYATREMFVVVDQQHRRARHKLCPSIDPNHLSLPPAPGTSFPDQHASLLMKPRKRYPVVQLLQHQARELCRECNLKVEEGCRVKGPVGD